MYRLTNYAFGFIIVYLFVLEAKMYDHALILTGFILSILIAFIAFFCNWITFDATKSVILLGTIVLGFGGWLLAFALIFFFVSSSLLTRRNRKHMEEKKNGDVTNGKSGKRRDGYQVWANGFWLALFCFGGFLTGLSEFMIAAFVAIAVAIADTWATEMGTHKPGKTLHILTLQETKPGAEGGISLKGTLAAVTGSAAVALFLLFNKLQLPISAIILVMVFGVIGCFIDSYLGAFFSRKQVKLPIPSDFSGSQNEFNNSVINWGATGLGGILAILLIQLLF